MPDFLGTKIGLKSIFVSLTAVLIFVTVGEIIFIYSTKWAKTTNQITGSNTSRVLRPEEFTTTVTNSSATASLPKSSPEKSDRKPFSSGKYLLWQDGMFLYKASDSAAKNNLPYALVGKVKNIDGREIDIYSGLDEVRVRLLEKYGEVAQIQRVNGKIVSSKEIPYTDVKSGNKIEAYSLKPISPNYFSTTQIFVILSETGN